MDKYSWAPVEIRHILKTVNNKLLIGCVAVGCDTFRHTKSRGDILSRLGNPKLRNNVLYCSEHNYVPGQTKFVSKQIESWPDNHKMCSKCKTIKNFSCFDKHRDCLFGLNSICKECRKPYSRRNYGSTSYEYRLYHSAKSRAKLKNIEFSLLLEDIVIPTVCPILGVPIVLSSGDFAPSVDRIDPTIGYHKYNIHVVSKRGNTLKNNMTKEESKNIYLWFKTLDRS